jgi:hypothetical protein
VVLDDLKNMASGAEGVGFSLTVGKSVSNPKCESDCFEIKNKIIWIWWNAI